MTAMAHAMLVMWSMLQSTTWHLLLMYLCLDVVMTILWGFRLPVVLLQSKWRMPPVVYQTRCFCTNVGNATERILADGRMAHAMLCMCSMLQITIGRLLLMCFGTDVVMTPTRRQTIVCLSSILWGLRLPVVLLQRTSAT